MDVDDPTTAAGNALPSTLHVEQLTLDQLPRLVGEQSVYRAANPAHYALVGKAPHAQRTYISRLNQVARLFSFNTYKDVPWQLLRYEHVKYIVQEFRKRQVAHTTINTTLAALRAVAKEAFNLRLLDGDDLARILNVKMEKGLRLPSGRHVPSGEILSLVQACERDPGPAGIRDIAIIGFMYICGLRRAEVAKLQLGDFDDTENTVRFIGKQNKERLCWPDSGTRDALYDWLDRRGTIEGPLFTPINKGGVIRLSNISDQAIYNMIQKRWKQAGVRPCSPHDFRRSFVTNLLENNTDILLTQRLAGHASPTTTMKYDRREDMEAQKVTEVLHLPYSRNNRTDI